VHLKALCSPRAGIFQVDRFYPSSDRNRWLSGFVNRSAGAILQVITGDGSNRGRSLSGRDKPRGLERIGAPSEMS